jgi:hypothetical protein
VMLMQVPVKMLVVRPNSSEKAAIMLDNNALF